MDWEAGAAPWRTAARGRRDLALGLGGLQALRRDDGSARPCSRRRRSATRSTWQDSRPQQFHVQSGVLAFARVFSLLSAIAAVCVGRSGDAEPMPTDTHEVKGGAVPSEPVGTA